MSEDITQKNIRLECLRLAVSLGLVDELEAKTVARAQKFYEFIVGPPISKVVG